MAYFVRIEDPKQFRLDILEDSKVVIGNLQAVRNVLFVREKKRELLDSLQDQVKEIGLLITEFDKLLPDKQLREEAAAKERSRNLTLKETPASKTKKKTPQKKVVATEKVVDEKDRLADALSSIERKLAALK